MSFFALPSPRALRALLALAAALPAAAFAHTGVDGHTHLDFMSTRGNDQRAPVALTKAVATFSATSG